MPCFVQSCLPKPGMNTGPCSTNMAKRILDSPVITVCSGPVQVGAWKGKNGIRQGPPALTGSGSCSIQNDRSSGWGDSPAQPLFPALPLGQNDRTCRDTLQPGDGARGSRARRGWLRPSSAPPRCPDGRPGGLGRHLLPTGSEVALRGAPAHTPLCPGWWGQAGVSTAGGPLPGAGTLSEEQEVRPVLPSGGLGEMTASGAGGAPCCRCTVCSYSLSPAHVSRSRLCN